MPGPIAVPDPTVPLLVPVPVWPEPLPRLEPVPEDAPVPVLGEVAEPMVVVPEPVLGAVALAPGAVDELVPGDVAEPVPDPLIVPELPVPLPSVEPVPAVWFPVVEPVPAAEPGGQFPLDASAPVDDDAPDVPVPELPEPDPLVCAAAQKDMVAVRPTASANATAFCIRPPLLHLRAPLREGLVVSSGTAVQDVYPRSASVAVSCEPTATPRRHAPSSGGVPSSAIHHGGGTRTVVTSITPGLDDRVLAPMSWSHGVVATTRWHRGAKRGFSNATEDRQVHDRARVHAAR